jgi:signal recognition particle subunit SRP54
MFDFLSQKFSGVLSWLKDRGRLTDSNISEAIEQVRTALLEADVPLRTIEDFLSLVQKDVVGKKIQQSLNPGQQFIKIVHERVLEFLGGKNNIGSISFQIPSVITVMGLQGAGKTTTVAKIAHWVTEQAKKHKKNRRILLGSIDFYRPAAIDQLEILARSIGVDFYRPATTNPVDAAKALVSYYKQHSYEHLFIDTAGRLHVDETMMQELKQVTAAINPKYKFLVLDAMTGQESLNVAKSFDQAIGFDFAVLSKMDSDTRGGAAFSFKYDLKKPIAFVGAGEKPADLESFIPERMTSRILGMGDIMTLIEKANDSMAQEDQEAMTRRMIQGHFTLKDFAEQMGMLDKLGSLQKIARYLPGMNSVSPELMEKGQGEIKQFKAIISSMTKKEQLVPEILDASRKKRIASGSGTNLQDVNKLLERFEQTKQFAKMLKNNNNPFKKFFK